MEDLKLTIAIPSYKRKEVIKKLLYELITNMKQHNNYEILVVDDASKDGTFDEIFKFHNEETVRVYENVENLGLVGNIYELFKRARGSYLLLLSNEDMVVHDNITKITSFIKKKHPVFISGQYTKNQGCGDLLYRGRRRTKNIKPSDFHASSFYISGLIYSVKECRPLLKAILDSGKFLSSFIYPQVLLTALLIVYHHEKCFWYNQPVAKQIHSLNPTVKMNDGSNYNTVLARWEQYQGFIDYFENYLMCPELNESNKKVLLSLIDGHKKALFHWLRWGIATSNKKYIKFFDDGARHYSKTVYFIKIKNMFNKLFRNNIHRIESHASEATKATWILTR